METIGSYLRNDHKLCDALFAYLEATIDEGKWEHAEAAFQPFDQAMERHLRMEETVLFPAFEKFTGRSDGPTSLLRNEHRHIRAVTSRLNEAVQKRSLRDFFDHVDTLRIIMEQHHQKEETILYFMTDRVFADRQREIIDAMTDIRVEAIPE